MNKMKPLTGLHATIDGKSVLKNNAHKVYNPAFLHDVVGEVTVCDAGDVDKAVDAAQAAWPGWAPHHLPKGPICYHRQPIMWRRTWMNYAVCLFWRMAKFYLKHEAMCSVASKRFVITVHSPKIGIRKRWYRIIAATWSLPASRSASCP